MLITLIIIILFPLLSLATTKQYLVQSNRMRFSQIIKSRAAEIPKISNPIILYSISTVRIEGYFSYNSSHHLVDTSKTESRLTISVQVSKVPIYEIILGYLVIESMPHIEDAIVKLTMEQNVAHYKSKKKILRNNDLNVAAHLMGFSSSKIAKENLFYTSVFDYNYQVWTSAQLSPTDYLIIHFFIMDNNYVENNTICSGSFIYSNSRANNAKSPYHVDIDKSLHILLGIEAINLPNADFSFNLDTRQVTMASTGAYSFSIIAINTSCEIFTVSKTYSDSKNQKAYSIVFIVFLVMASCASLILLILCVSNLYNKRKMQRSNQQYNVSVEDRLQLNEEERKGSAIISVLSSQKQLKKKLRKIDKQPSIQQAPQTENRIKSNQNMAVKTNNPERKVKKKKKGKNDKVQIQ